MVSFKNILVPVDFGESSKEALAVAIDLSKQYHSALTLIHTWEVPAYGYGAMGVSPVDVLTPFQERRAPSSMRCSPRSRSSCPRRRRSSRTELHGARSSPRSSRPSPTWS